MEEPAKPANNITVTVVPAEMVIAAAEDVTVSFRHHLSVNHYKAARHFVDLAGKSEGEAVSFYVLGAVASSVAFVESTINELLQNCHDKFPYRLDNIHDEHKAMLAGLWAAIGPEDERCKILDKYQAALKVCGRESMSEGGKPYQQCKVVIDVRNATIHFKPVSATRGSTNSIEKKLRPMPYKRAYSIGNPEWPDNFIYSPDAARWAVESCVAFVDEVAVRLNWSPPFTLVRT